MPAWLIWLIIAGALALAETASVTLVFAMFAGGAAAAALVAGLGAPVWLQLIVAALASVALLAGLRPLIRRHLFTGPSTPSGSERLLGQEAVVTHVVTAYEGRVRLNGGEWTARAANRDLVLPVGTLARVVRIDGATAVVEFHPDLGYAGETAVR